MPIIGITTSISEDEAVLQMNRNYISAVAHTGALPLLLPATEEPQAIAAYAALCSGLLLSGGDDVDPSAYGEGQSWHCGAISPLRDAFELQLCREFLRLRKPILAICRGIQVLNVALGGTLHQDLMTDLPGSLAHRQMQKSWHVSHPVAIAEGSYLADLITCDMLAVNSHHHQAVATLGEGVTVAATAPDGVIEAIEVAGQTFCLGVQWHPERLWDQPGMAAHARLFEAFTAACETP